ncbi:universal stress protein [Myxococcaceae bacterium JPH2]|nr:universal stress protein [Myxococcaceae bacterium JPH2]
MSIVFGTDFSSQAMEAAETATALAHRMGESLHLVHVTEYGSGGRSKASDEALQQGARARLEEQAEALRARGVAVEAHLLEGVPDEVLVDLATSQHAALIVLSRHGQRAPRWRMGSVAERVVESAHCPVLVLQNARSMEAWASGVGSLRVLLGLSFSPPSDAAVAWVKRMRSLGPCEVIAAHHYWGVDAHARYGLPLTPGAEATPEAEQALRRDLLARLGDMPGSGAVWVQLQSGLGRPSEALVSLAGRESVDLIVVGTHQRTGARRWWYGSVSQHVLQNSSTNVLCVPVSALQPLPLPSVRRVLVPTDLSDWGSAAARYAYALVPEGGAVCLLHVAEPGSGETYDPRRFVEPMTPEARAQRERVEVALRALIPEEAAARRVTTEVEIVASRRVAEAVGQAAERLDCDFICMASHGRTGLSRALAGSVAQEVIMHGVRPVFVVRPPRDE